MVSLNLTTEPGSHIDLIICRLLIDLHIWSSPDKTVHLIIPPLFQYQTGASDITHNTLFLKINKSYVFSSNMMLTGNLCLFSQFVFHNRYTFKQSCNLRISNNRRAKCKILYTPVMLNHCSLPEILYLAYKHILLKKLYTYTMPWWNLLSSNLYCKQNKQLLLGSLKIYLLIFSAELYKNINKQIIS